MLMKTMLNGVILALIAISTVACDAFHTLNNKKSAQGRPYELIVVCPQMEWNGELGDSIRAVFTAPVPYLNQVEPLFDVLRVTERGFKDMIADHRNILKIVVDPSLEKAETAVEYDVTSEPQIVLTLQGPDDKALVGYLSENRDNMLHVLEKAERDRDVKAYHLVQQPRNRGRRQEAIRRRNPRPKRLRPRQTDRRLPLGPLRVSDRQSGVLHLFLSL